MLAELRIARLGVIDEAVLDLGPGFTAITGETGAGKTMVVTGLSLLLGTKADARLVRVGSRRAAVEGRFVPPQGVAKRLGSLGGELDEGELIVARQIGGTRSRAFAGGAQVPAAVAAGLLAEWVTLHGQSEQIRLSTPERQREVLDASAGAELAGVLDEYRRWYAERSRDAAELDALVAAARERAREADALGFALAEIERVGPQPGEEDDLAAQAGRLQAADDLRLAGRTAAAALVGDDETSDDAPNALGLISAARKALELAGRRDEMLAGLGERVAEAAYVLGDVAAELSAYLADLDADPARLEWIAGRRAELAALLRKYGATTGEVVEWARAAGSRLEELGGSDERIGALSAAVAAADERLDALAGTLTRLRTAAAARLAKAAMAELAALAMPNARLEFRISAAPKLGPEGRDQVVLLFSANPGSDPAPLGRVASGGELSRVRLALEVVLAAGSVGQVFVFDEVDAGIGGAVALEVGARLARLARHAQVIAVTHLAQVAAFADVQFVVAKSSDGQVTTSGVRRVDADERLGELARMMGGLEDVAAARAHAAELLAAAVKSR